MSKFKIALLTIPLLPIFTYSQLHTDQLESARLEFVESMYKWDAKVLRKYIPTNAKTPDQIDSILFEALDHFSTCMVRAANVQSQSGALPLDYVLKEALRVDQSRRDTEDDRPRYDLSVLSEMRSQCRSEMFQILTQNAA